VSPFAGVLADRYPRRRLLLVVQSLAMLQALTLSFLVLTHTVRVWQICALSMFMGLVTATDVPVRQAFTAEMLEHNAGNVLGNAIALNSTMVNIAKLIGPTIAGLLIPLVGEGVCFLLNAISYLAVIASLLAMRVADRTPVQGGKHMLLDLKEGFDYARRVASVRHILLLLAVASLMGQPYLSLLPVFAKDVLRGGPNALGFLMASSGAGALIGALYLASRTTVRGLEKKIAAASVVFGLGLAAFSASRNLYLSMALLVVAGSGMMVQNVGGNTTLQSITGEDMRGRVMSFYAMAVMGMSPFGSLLAGAVATRIGTCQTVMAGGLCCAAAALFFATRSSSIRESLLMAFDNTHPQAELVTAGARPPGSS
jgi:MFS family permease